MRKLASIQVIKDISPIPKADLIEVAAINGWKSVIKKGEYSVGDVVVYCEIDSWIPTAIAPFLSVTPKPKFYEGVEGNRLRTVKLRGQLSQGLILPLNLKPELKELPIGTDVSELLNIKKYEPPIPAQISGDALGAFPSFIEKTDEPRVQNLDYESDILSVKTTWVITEKLDGSSVTYYVNGTHFGACSRNLELKCDPKNSIWKFAYDYRLEYLMKKIAKNFGDFAIQGEFIGPGIQGNKYKLDKHIFVPFTIFGIGMHRKASFDYLERISSELCLKPVPLLAQGTDILPGSMDEILKLANGETSYNKSRTRREGLVIRSYDQQISFKVISNKFLLKDK